ncbi:hypothetical protein BDY21DRAFT_5023 [Lineolata rhizophorae]|uniref:Uncharacterized protein n=1 Tax=Lineolata rhizophorae TaxID=578093 RepID=A0A6A6PDE3_9PEZI|nr:hypothetical protein BDY21DRAFT_5023 [Lineolata rhizophorae]
MNQEAPGSPYCEPCPAANPHTTTRPSASSHPTLPLLLLSTPPSPALRPRRPAASCVPQSEHGSDRVLREPPARVQVAAALPRQPPRTLAAAAPGGVDEKAPFRFCCCWLPSTVALLAAARPPPRPLAEHALSGSAAFQCSADKARKTSAAAGLFSSLCCPSLADLVTPAPSCFAFAPPGRPPVRLAL